MKDIAWLDTVELKEQMKRCVTCGLRSLADAIDSGDFQGHFHELQGVGLWGYTAQGSEVLRLNLVIRLNAPLQKTVSTFEELPIPPFEERA